MASVNEVIIVDNRERDPEVRHNLKVEPSAIRPLHPLRHGKTRLLAISVKKPSDFVVVYNRMAEIAGEYSKKGRDVYAEGRLKTYKC